MVMWVGDDYEIWRCADQANRIKLDCEELARTAWQKAKEVTSVLFGTDELWKYGPAFARFVREMQQHVDGRKAPYPGNEESPTERTW